MTGETSDLPKGRKAALKRIAWGLVALAFSIGFFEYLVENPYHEFLLIQNAQTAPGHVTDTWEEAESGDDGGTHWTCSYTYVFQLPDGREVTAYSGHRSGQLRPEFSYIEEPVPVEVEYFPTDPSINRIKGDGCQTVLEWFLRKVCVGGFLLVMLCLPGGYLLRDGIKALRSTSRVGPSSDPPSSL